MGQAKDANVEKVTLGCGLGRNRRTRRGLLGSSGGWLTLSILSLSLFCALCFFPEEAVASASCRGGCMNGGTMLMPNNIFGFCRCQCSGGHTGPRCQFTSRKRSSPDMTPGGWVQWVPGEDPETGPQLAGGEPEGVDLPMTRNDVWFQLRKRLHDIEQFAPAHGTGTDDEYDMYKS